MLFDQRDAGQSTPLGEVCNNTLALLIADIDHIRTLLGIAQWLVFGGFWGSTLALAYGQAHPVRCTGFVLRGIFLCTPAEIDWFLHGIRWFFPEEHARFVAPVPGAERGVLLARYRRQLFSGGSAHTLRAARTWGRYEGSTIHLIPDP